MFSTIKKLLIVLVLLIIVIGGGYWFFYRSKSNNSTSSQTSPTKTSEEENDWGNISGWFLENPELVEEWKDNNFTYEQVQDWINVGLRPNDISFASYLCSQGHTPEWFLNHGNGMALRQEWANKREKNERIEEIASEIGSRLNTWADSLGEFNLSNYSSEGEEKLTKKAIEKTIEYVKTPYLDNKQKLFFLQKFLKNYQQKADEEEESSSSDEEDFTTTFTSYTPNLDENYSKIQELVQEWQDILGTNKKPNNSNQQKYFKDGEKITEKEMDWAIGNMERNKEIEILPASYFRKVKERKFGENILFENLLDKIKDGKELVFIPVNNKSHWSLLVYEKSSGLFYHYHHDHYEKNRDFTNFDLSLLLSELKPSLKSNIDGEWWKKNVENRSNNQQAQEYDSGIAMISLMEKIIILYNTKFRIIPGTMNKDGNNYSISKQNLAIVENSIGNFDYNTERKKWQARYLDQKKY